MTRQSIRFDQLQVKAHHLWAEQWLLLTCGDFTQQEFNTMTVAWGSLGTMWARPFAQVVVRPGRYTYDFMERFDTFTLSVFPERYRTALTLLGTKSGRDGDKISASGLTPIASTEVASPAFAEAELILECRKIYSDRMDPQQFFDPTIQENYPQKDFHIIYFGQVVAILGESSYRG